MEASVTLLQYVTDWQVAALHSLVFIRFWGERSVKTNVLKDNDLLSDTFTVFGEVKGDACLVCSLLLMENFLQ